MNKNPDKHIDKPRINRSGQKVHSWTLLHVSGVKRLKNSINDKHTVIWMYSCRCDCGGIHDVGWPDIAAGRSTKCFDCHLNQEIINSQKNVRRFKNSNSNYKGTEDIPRLLHTRAKYNAMSRNIAFDITIEDIQNQWDKQEGLCYYTGQLLSFYMTRERDKRNSLSSQASLDRVDSSLGYTIDNIVWTTKTINCIKMDLNEKDFVKLCGMVYTYNKDKV